MELGTRGRWEFETNIITSFAYEIENPTFFRGTFLNLKLFDNPMKDLKSFIVFDENF